jgi:hypothetical protein
MLAFLGLEENPPAGDQLEALQMPDACTPNRVREPPVKNLFSAEGTSLPDQKPAMAEPLPSSERAELSSSRPMTRSEATGQWTAQRLCGLPLADDITSDDPRPDLIIDHGQLQPLSVTSVCADSSLDEYQFDEEPVMRSPSPLDLLEADSGWHQALRESELELLQDTDFLMDCLVGPDRLI